MPLLGRVTSHRCGYLGRNLLVAFMPWEGHNYEDAIILNQRIALHNGMLNIARREKVVKRECGGRLPNPGCSTNEDQL